MTESALVQAEEWAAECGAAFNADPDDAELRQWWLDALADLRRIRTDILTAASATHPAA
ncbi:hypothetical protein ACGFZP_12860 [Kitasatospora sp. NPDC048239]|uniref:hypothetical protein n=1 Tax=Kitasatospora sp. NPDC048239 TaxID=3364046 RepID=UPI0037182A9F